MPNKMNYTKSTKSWIMNYYDDYQDGGYTQEELDDMFREAMTGGQYDDEFGNNGALSDSALDCLGF
jgi:hypothetical protein